ncbi:isochorismatase family protein [Sciscionella sediminilitoris]|uniref:isochorismatase family protein n=1 Tax=Sciscionella sediminilitoris TaxID=1445613 RepID=UPI0004DF3133|nr:isochorismatase family protein [Sciscionella sp. SE31]
MTTLVDRPNSALLVLDMQNGVLAQAHDRDTIVATVASLVARARAGEVPVLWMQHCGEELPEGSEGWQYVSELVPYPDEPVLRKSYADAFEETGLEQALAERGAGRVFLAGAQTDECIRSTLHGAIVRGYDTILIADAHTTEDLSRFGAPTPEQVIAHTNLYWRYHQAPGRTAGTVTSAELDFAAPGRS